MADTSRDDLSGSLARENTDTLAASDQGSSAPSTGPVDARARALLEISPTVASSPTDTAIPVDVSFRRSELAAGTLLDADYRVISVLGRGGMGTVYLVEHNKLGRRFAAKVISDALADDPVLIARLHAEARVASRLRHENIVDVTHLGQTSTGAIFIVMELLEGRDLRALLEDAGGALSFELVKEIAEDLFAGLVAAHAQGVVHRDLKPDNVFVTTTERGRRAKIVDFGIAKSGSGHEDLGLTRTGQVFGTPLYMSPEQARNTATVDARSDQYSLGVLLFELLTGKLPFEAKNAYELVVMHATESPRALRLFRPELPEAVEAVVLRCLAKKPDDRFADLAALREAWRAAWSTQPAAVDPPKASEHAPPKAPEHAPPERPRSVAPFALVGLLGLLGAGAYFGWPREGSPPEDAPVVPTVTSPSDAGVGRPDVVVEPVLPVEPDAPSATRTIHSRPEGASVSVDDEVRCTTPCTLELPAEGPLEIALRLRGYGRVTRVVGLGDPEEITVELERERSTDPPPALAPR
jgi:serine/threonine protein kinase